MGTNKMGLGPNDTPVATGDSALTFERSEYSWVHYAQLKAAYEAAGIYHLDTCWSPLLCLKFHLDGRHYPPFVHSFLGPLRRLERAPAPFAFYRRCLDPKLVQAFLGKLPQGRLRASLEEEVAAERLEDVRSLQRSR